MSEDETCIICKDDESSDRQIIVYEHTCGKYNIHDSCLEEWHNNYPNSCFLCRNDIEYKKVRDDLEKGVVTIIVNDSIVAPNKKRCKCECKKSTLGSFLIIVIVGIVMTLYYTNNF